VHFAQWIGPSFAVAVSRLVTRYLNGEVTTEESEVAAAESGLKFTRPRYDGAHHLYLRGYSKIVAERRIAKKVKATAAVPLSFKVIKFGIAANLDVREDAYGYDDGFFFDAIKMPQKYQCEHVERVLIALLKPCCIKGKQEYILTDDLCAFLQIEPPTSEEDYRQLMRRVYVAAVSLAHSLYPEIIDRPLPFGQAYEPIEIPSVIAQLDQGSSSANAVNLTRLSEKCVDLTWEDMAVYEYSLPGIRFTAARATLDVEREKTKQMLLQLLGDKKISFEQYTQALGSDSKVPTPPPGEQVNGVAREESTNRTKAKGRRRKKGPITLDPHTLLQNPVKKPHRPKGVPIEWTDEEVADLTSAVLEHGYQWKAIKASTPTLSRHFEGMRLRDKCLQIRRKALKEDVDLATFEGGAYKDPIPGKDDDLYEIEPLSSGEPTAASLLRPAPRKLPKEKKRVSPEWTKEEVDALRKGVSEHAYNWSAIRRYYRSELSRHDGIMALRDKVLQIRRRAIAEGYDLTKYEGGVYKYPIPGKDGYKL
jgi:hypothetical protein